MGLYPHVDFTEEGDLLVKTEDHMTGLVTKTYYQQVLKIEERTDCFCCSCPNGYSDDPACRNHGFAGKRPCLTHNMPGQVWDDDMMFGPEGPPADHVPEMPESVQWMRELDRHPWHELREDCVQAPHSHWPGEWPSESVPDAELAPF